MKTSRYSEEDFNIFLQELIDNKVFNDGKEEGITKRVMEEGFENLKGMQSFVFIKAISPFVTEECANCGEDIPWGEMFFASDNGGLCTWCYQVRTKND